MERLQPSDAILLLKSILESGYVIPTENFRYQQREHGLDCDDFLQQAVEKGVIREPSTRNWLDSSLPAYKLEAVLTLDESRRWVSIDFCFHGLDTVYLFACGSQELRNDW